MEQESVQFMATKRPIRKMERRIDRSGKFLKVSDYFGELLFDFKTAQGIPENIRRELMEAVRLGKKINKESAEILAQVVTEWAVKKGTTHFCHWFQPLTGTTAEKHDAFLQIKNSKAIEKLEAHELMQGEPDASSFPHGGSRSTFEARGYTTWDLTSPMFISEGPNGKTLCIPTAFVSYHGDALDIKTPLLRSLTCLNKSVVKFLHLIGNTEVQNIIVTTGCEQEYFLIDKSFYYKRPDLVMSGRTVFGAPTIKGQQLEDHYLGLIPERVLAFMQELDYELHRLGIPAKTRHNEVAPGQFEMAPIFSEANIASDQNQLLMATIKKTAFKHDMVALFHEKPFNGINGSGKHINWSMQTDSGINLLSPGNAPHHNRRFLAFMSIIFEATYRYQGALRMAIASSGNDHRLGAHEAPPSIISVFLGDTLGKIFDAIFAGRDYLPTDRIDDEAMDFGASQLAQLLKDNTDRNRTSPLAFTGNKFEFRVVGASAAVGLPLSILNGAVSKVMEESCEIVEAHIKNGASYDDALRLITKKWTDSSYKKIVFNGDGYSKDWEHRAQELGLKNLKNTPEALKILDTQSEIEFLITQKIFRASELATRYKVLIERYNKIREIEFKTLINLIKQNIIPMVFEYKSQLLQTITVENTLGIESTVEKDILKKLNNYLQNIYSLLENFEKDIFNLERERETRAHKLAQDILPKSIELSKLCNEIENIIPTSMWNLPKYYDMLFLR